MNNIPIHLIYHEIALTGHASPLEASGDYMPTSLIIYIHGWRLGILTYQDKKWIMDQPIDPKIIPLLENYIHSHMQFIKKAMDCQ